MANILKKFKNNFKDITEYYNYLVAKTKKHEQQNLKAVAMHGSRPALLPAFERCAEGKRPQLHIVCAMRRAGDSLPGTKAEHGPLRGLQRSAAQGNDIAHAAVGPDSPDALLAEAGLHLRHDLRLP